MIDITFFVPCQIRYDLFYPACERYQRLTTGTGTSIHLSLFHVSGILLFLLTSCHDNEPISRFARGSVGFYSYAPGTHQTLHCALKFGDAEGVVRGDREDQRRVAGMGVDGRMNVDTASEMVGQHFDEFLLAGGLGVGAARLGLLGVESSRGEHPGIPDQIDLLPRRRVV